MYHRDKSKREHLVTIDIPSDYPNSAPICFSDLPLTSSETNKRNNNPNSSNFHSSMITKNWNGKTSKIKDILEQFGKLFEMFQDFWYFFP